MVFLRFFGVRVPESCIPTDRLPDLTLEQPSKIIGPKIKKVAIFVVVPATIRKKVATIVGRYAAQTVPAQLLLIPRRLYGESGEAEFPAQASVINCDIACGVSTPRICIVSQKKSRAGQPCRLAMRR